MEQNFSKRKQWIWNNCVPKLVQNINDNERKNFNAQTVFDIFCRADPSTNGSAIQWLVNVYLKKGFRFDDIQAGENSKVNRTLRLFNRYRKQLDLQKRSLYAYKTLAELYVSVEPYYTQDKSKDNDVRNVNQSLKQKQKIQAQTETYTLYKNPELNIVIPLTKFAAQWWGKGTQWCTASTESENYFESYNRQAPLFVIMFKDKSGKNRRLQLWTIEDDFQFMDETDTEVTNEFVEQHWNLLKTILLLSIDSNTMILNQFDFSFADELFFQALIVDCKISISHVKKHIAHIKPELFEKLSWIALKQDPFQIQYLPPNLVDQTVCDQVIEQNNRTFAWIPVKYRSADICERVVRLDGKALRYVPDYRLRDNPNLYRLGCEQTGLALQFVPQSLLTRSLCQTAFDHNTLAFQWIPEKFQTQEMCTKAVKKHGLFLLELVAEKYFEFDFLVYSLQFNPYSLEKIINKRKDLKDEQASYLYSIACELNGKLLQHVPVHLKTYNLCLSAVEKNGWAIQFVPPELVDYTIALEAVKYHGWLLKTIVDRFPHLVDDRLCETATNKNTSSLKYVPQNMQTVDMYKNAMQKDPNRFDNLHTLPINLTLVRLWIKDFKKSLFLLETKKEWWAQFTAEKQKELHQEFVSISEKAHAYCYQKEIEHNKNNAEFKESHNQSICTTMIKSAWNVKDVQTSFDHTLQLLTPILDQSKTINL